MEEEQRICFSDPIEVYTRRGQLIGHYFKNGDYPLGRAVHFPIMVNNRRLDVVLDHVSKPISEGCYRMVLTVRKKHWEYLQYLNNFVEFKW